MLLLLASLLVSQVSSAMVAGQPVAADSPFAKSSVAILFGNGNRCTGALIAPKLVLTAAHCVLSEKASYKIAFASDLTAALQGKEQVAVRGVSQFIRHPDLAKNDRLSDDVALIELSDAAPAGTEIASIASTALELVAGQKIYSLGYGLQNANAIPLPMVPPPAGQKGIWEPVQLVGKELTVATPEKEEFAGVKLNFHRLFVKQPEGGICGGDSGGPVYVKGANGEEIIVGVNGATVPDLSEKPADLPNCAANAYVTRIDQTADWILAAIQQSR